ncbi:MAG TPA: helix-turn-helix domain-containing protein, partial [Ktedonobacteraceae bacterium]|nr:helix-turn-helix domain-containing protein [Ktedonobacteraceae bacterium]
EEHRQAVIRLHAQGRSISTIARYLDISRPTVYATLKRWVEEGIQGLPDKSHVMTPSHSYQIAFDPLCLLQS